MIKGLSLGHGLCLLLTSATALRTRLVSVRILNANGLYVKTKPMNSVAKFPHSPHLEQRQHQSLLTERHRTGWQRGHRFSHHRSIHFQLNLRLLYQPQCYWLRLRSFSRTRTFMPVLTCDAVLIQNRTSLSPFHSRARRSFYPGTLLVKVEIFLSW